MVGAVAIEEMATRVDRFQNVLDAPAKPYSPNGPIYVAISGVGTITRLPKRVSGLKLKDLPAGIKGSLTVKRTKTTLGGREVFTAKDIATLKRRGVVVIDARKKKGKTTKVTGIGGAVVRTHHSLKFQNWAAYKKALGKSGNRDLQLSGRMRNTIAIVTLTDSSVEIGFNSTQENLKALGNQAIDPWFGLSPNNKTAVVARMQQLLNQSVSTMLRPAA